jgi:hypothetical protein
MNYDEVRFIEEKNSEELWDARRPVMGWKCFVGLFADVFLVGLNIGRSEFFAALKSVVERYGNGASCTLLS